MRQVSGVGWYNILEGKKWVLGLYNLYQFYPKGINYTINCIFYSVPSGVPLVNVSEEGDYVLVTWTEPQDPNGDLRYNVSVEERNLFRGTSVNSDYIIVMGMTEQLLFNITVTPYFNYTASVVPFTTPGSGPSSTGFLATMEEGYIF